MTSCGKMAGLQFFGFYPPADRIRMFVEKAGSFFDGNDVVHLQHEYTTSEFGVMIPVGFGILYHGKMKIKFMGAAGTVTGSSYVLTSGSGQSVLIDFGMFQGPEVDHLNYEPYAYDCGKLSGVILTHAHLDHCGRLPLLLHGGFASTIWMTPETADLTELSLLDSAKVAKEGHRRMLYDKNLALQTIKRFERAYYRTPFVIGDLTVTFRDAGHILGSAIVEIVDAHPDSGIRKIVFSGDLGNSPDNLLLETEQIRDADAVVMESTYGDRLHPTEDPMEVLADEIRTVEASGGTLLIPAFSLQRTQRLMHMLMHLKADGKVKKETPVYMDSPMGNTATHIYSRYPEDFNGHTQGEFNGTTPFDFPGLIVVGKRKESMAVDKDPGAKVIIAGSGMMTGGRILAHAVRYLPVPSTRVLIVGYQGFGTLGRTLTEKNITSVKIDGVPVRVRAVVRETQSMSSHADQQQLLDWLKPIKSVKKVFLTHGEDGPRKMLLEKITNDLGIADVTLPHLHEEIAL